MQKNIDEHAHIYAYKNHFNYVTWYQLLEFTILQITKQVIIN
jgi:hypothetical protein